MKKVAVLSVIALLGAANALSAPPVAATDISLESRTYVPARGTDGGSTHVLLYEYLSLDAEDIARPGVYLRAGGWGRTDLADETFGRKSNSELQYAFLGWRAPQLNAEVRVGRLSLTAGVARHEVLDGLLLGSDLPAGFDVTFFGGVPVEVGEESRSKDTLYGGRVSQGRAGLYRLGASYLKEQNAGDDAREEAGSDLFLAPLPLVEVTGTSLYNLIADKWARHDYRLVLGQFAKRVRLTAHWATTDYTAYFQEPMNHAMLPVEDEKRDRLGGEVEVVLGLGFVVAGEYVSYRIPKEGSDGSAYGARLDWTGPVAAAGAGYRDVSGEAPEDRYWELSVHATTAFGPARVSASAEHLAYEVEINGKKTATTGKLALSYAASKSFELSASGEYGQTPEYDREVRGFFAMTWRYDASSKEGGTK
ncbi:MAG: hypothetical protein ACYC9Y_01935 [Candidatus Methylomirabilia bacterium]